MVCKTGAIQLPSLNNRNKTSGDRQVQNLHSKTMDTARKALIQSLVNSASLQQQIEDTEQLLILPNQSPPLKFNNNQNESILGQDIQSQNYKNETSISSLLRKNNSSTIGIENLGGHVNDFQNIIDMQYRMNEIDEELEIINQITSRQAIIVELENQRQRLASQELLSQFSTLDQLVARQETINRLFNHQFDSLVPSEAPNASVAAQTLVATVGTTRIEQMLGRSSNQIDLTSLCSLSGRSSNVSPRDILNSHTINSNPAQVSRTSSIESSTDLPQIRYFNNGHEVNEHGKNIMNDDNSKKRKDHPVNTRKKKKSLNSSKSSSQIHTKLYKKRKIFENKTTQNHNTYISSTKETIPNTATNKSIKPGPHHDLMLELFSQMNDSSAKECNELKMDAAAALLDFQKS